MKFKDKLRVSIFIDPAVAANFSVYALIHRKSVSRFVEELMKKELKNMDDPKYFPANLKAEFAKDEEE